MGENIGGREGGKEGEKRIKEGRKKGRGKERERGKEWEGGKMDAIQTAPSTPSPPPKPQQLCAKKLGQNIFAE